MLVLGVIGLARIAPISAELASAQDPADIFLDPSTGAIEGRTALGVLAGSLASPGDVQIHPPDGFFVHLVGVDDPSIELVHPAGQWFRPPPDTYRIWICSEWLISPHSRLIGYAGRPFSGRGFRVVLSVEEGGKVAGPDPQLYDAGVELRILHAGAYASPTGAAGLELVRRQRLELVEGGVLMPTGRTVAALWDPAKGVYIALSRPFDVAPRSIFAPKFVPPRDQLAHLIVQLRRDQILSSSAEYDLQPSLTVASRTVSADVTVEAADIAYALWYDLPAGSARIKLDSAISASIEADLTLRPGEIHRLVLEQPPVIDLQKLR